MVEVFKTNVQNALQSHMLLGRLKELFPHLRSSFDLDDCDRILRIEAPSICATSVSNVLNDHGFDCSLLT
jgi:hypothetical protein